jgi:hypothetical protein
MQHGYPMFATPLQKYLQYWNDTSSRYHNIRSFSCIHKKGHTSVQLLPPRLQASAARRLATGRLACCCSTLGSLLVAPELSKRNELHADFVCVHVLQNGII